MTMTVAAMSLRPGDVAHIAPHACHGIPVDCGRHNIEVTAVRWAGEGHHDVVVDYDPWACWPGDRPGSHGSVLYERTARVALLWHAMGAAS